MFLILQWNSKQNIYLDFLFMYKKEKETLNSGKDTLGVFISMVSGNFGFLLAY